MDKKELKILSGSESYGGNHSCHLKVMINSNKYDALTEETQNDLGYEATKFIEAMRNRIELEYAKQHYQKERQENIEKMKELFHKAGFELVYSTIIDNQYSSHPVYYPSPWLEVTTAKGPIIIGWRKRVINIDWSKSDITQSAEDLFPKEDVTKGDQSIHAWGYEKAVDYLSELNNAEKV